MHQHQHQLLLCIWMRKAGAIKRGRQQTRDGQRGRRLPPVDRRRRNSSCLSLTRAAPPQQLRLRLRSQIPLGWALQQRRQLRLRL